MLVYGDVERVETVDAKQRSVEAALAQARSLPPGLERHAALVTAFIGASELVQGIIDAEFHARGCDAFSEVHGSSMECLLLLARAVHESWQSGFSANPPPGSLLAGLSGCDPGMQLRIKHAEGYAFYALYPESYLEAAARSGLGPNTKVIGIRSIGAGLSALVAAALRAPPPFTIRPVGHPFQREVRVDPVTAQELTADREARFAVVDEGPGLSGSSFGATADWLEAAGIPRERIHFFPSHGGDLGPQASERHRARWRNAPRHLVTMDDLLFEAPGRSLAAWIEGAVGPPEQPLEDISGGAWRHRRYADEADWPAANLQQERRKFLAQAGGAPWLVKFIGLGEIGQRKYDQAQALHAAGFTPAIAGLRHGFLVERWHEDAPSLDRTPIERMRLVEEIGSYLAFRARSFPAGTSRGASLSELRHMAIYNAQQTLGAAAAVCLEQALASPARLEGKARPVFTDNRMHAWEWLVVGERLLKADAVDHSAAHDLVGPQDIAWDIAGAAAELDLSDDEVMRLCRIIERDSGHPVDHDLLSFMRPCYLAFQLGAHTMAADPLGEGAEATRLREAARRYAALLRNDETAAAGPETTVMEPEEMPLR